MIERLFGWDYPPGVTTADIDSLTEDDEAEEEEGTDDDEG